MSDNHSTNSGETITLTPQDTQKAEFLREALRCKDNNEAVSESLHVARQAIKVVQEGGKVIFQERNGMANELKIRT